MILKYLRLLLISIAALFLVVTAISLFFPSHIHISRAVQVNASKDSVMTQIAELQNWQYWFPGADSLKPLIVDDKIKGIETGDGKALMITGITDSSVVAENTGPKSKKGEMGWNIISSNYEANATIQWYMDFHLKWYPWEKFSGLLLDKVYGPQMEKGLENLKKLVENK